MSTHHCARPVMAGGDQPWSCPVCGWSWEPLPPEPVAHAGRAAGPVSTRTLVTVCVVLGVVALVALPLSREVFVLAICGILLTAMVRMWQELRDM
ncbi:hypothetical protein [Nonomuraea aridisoli]|nr:hypothetical protein [Nonomuraea aridisoli]